MLGLSAGSKALRISDHYDAAIRLHDAPAHSPAQAWRFNVCGHMQAGAKAVESIKGSIPVIQSLCRYPDARNLTMKLHSRSRPHEVDRKGLRHALMAIAVLVGPPSTAFAAKSNCTALQAPTALLPTGTYTVPRDAPVGTLIGAFSEYLGGPTTQMQCSRTSSGEHVLGVLISGETGAIVTIGGEKFSTAPTSRPGISVIARARLYRNGAPVGSPMAVNQTSDFVWPDYSSFSNHTFGVSYSLALVKTGAATSGTVSWAAGPQLQLFYADDEGFASGINSIANGSATISVPTCSVNTNDVNLPRTSTSSLTSVGARGEAMDFTIDLMNCPAGLSSLTFRLDPAPAVPIIDASQGIIGLSSLSRASGVGVQILDGLESALPLATLRAVPGYSPVTGGSLSIPLRAAFVRTAVSMAPGYAESQLLLTLRYE